MIANCPNSKSFVISVNDGQWEVYFDRNEYGYTPIVDRGYERKTIPLSLEERDVISTIRKIEKLGDLGDVPFELFRDIVAGAASLSMKYG